MLTTDIAESEIINSYEDVMHIYSNIAFSFSYSTLNRLAVNRYYFYYLKTAE